MLAPRFFVDAGRDADVMVWWHAATPEALQEAYTRLRLSMIAAERQRVLEIVEQARLADQVGLDVFGVGEHHRHEFAVSSPELVLAAAAARTEKIHLGTAVTVLSSDDPVRVYERFATLDAVSNGRAEIVAGRGSFTESFPLFGFDLGQYDQLFAEKFDLFTQLVADQGPVTWEGNVRSALDKVTVYPTLEHGPLPTWLAVGGSPRSVVRSAQYGIP